MSDSVSVIAAEVAALAATLLRAEPALVGFLRGVVGDLEQARDCVQDTFYVACREARSGNAPFQAPLVDDDVRRWLFRVGYRQAVDVLRRRGIVHFSPLSELAGDRPQLTPVSHHVPFEDSVAESAVLGAALARLSAEDRACLVLNVIHGYTINEIAPLIDSTPIAAKRRLARAKQRLRTAYNALDQRTDEGEHHGS